MVFNAIGIESNLILVEHARRNIFSKGEWDCISFMYAGEDDIDNDAKYLLLLKDDLGLLNISGARSLLGGLSSFHFTNTDFKLQLHFNCFG